MEYKIEFTAQCLEDIDEICEYILNKLKTEKVAHRLRIHVMNNAKRLSTCPEMYMKIGKVDRARRQYRRIPINNYVLLYTIDEENKIVYISHMYYGRRNYLEGLI